jgi:hypothetical protein
MREFCTSGSVGARRAQVAGLPDRQSTITGPCGRLREPPHRFEAGTRRSELVARDETWPYDVEPIVDLDVGPRRQIIFVGMATALVSRSTPRS